MTTPTLALGISAAGAQQVADLAAAVAALKNNLVQLGQTAGGNSLGSLDKLTSEFQQMRQEMVQAVQGLRTDLAAGFNQAFTAAALQVKAGGSKVEDEVKASAARIKSASKEMDLGNAMLVATDKYRAIQERQIADTIAFEEKQKTAWASYQQALNARLAEEATAMDYAVSQYRKLQDQQVADQISFEEKQKASWVTYQDALDARLAKEATAMDYAVSQYRNLQAQQIADTIAFEEKQKASWIAYQAELDKRLALEATAMEGAAAQFRAIQAQQIADQIAAETKQAGLFYASQAAMEKQAAAAAALTIKGAARQTGEVVGDFSSILPATYGQLKQVDSEAKSFTETLKNLQPTSRSTREALSMVTEGIQGRFKNLGGSIVAMLNALGLAPFIITPAMGALVAAAAVVATFTVAVEKGQSELKNFENEAIITGNAIGISSSQFTALRDSLVGISVTKGAASDALDAIAKSGLLASANVEQIATTAILMQRAVGQPLADTVKQFDALGKSPAEASAKLNEQYHFLTASIYDQINALEQHGQKQAAADLAEKTYAEEMSKRSQTILDNLGTLQAAWYGLGNMARSAWDKMLDIGREQSTADKMKTAAYALDQAQAAMAAGQTQTAAPPGSWAALTGGATPTAQSQADAAKATLNDLLRRSEIESGEVILRDRLNKQAEAAVTWDKQGNTLQKTRLGLEAQIEATRANGIAAGRTELEIEQRIALLRERYKRGGGGATRAGTITGQSDVADAQTALYQGLMDTNNTTQVSQLTNAEKQLITINDQLKTATDASKKSQLEAAAAAAEAAIPHEKLAQEVKNQYDNWIKDIAQTDASTKANDKSAESIRNKVEQLQQQNATLGKSKTAIEEANLAEYQRQLREAEASDTFDPKYVASLRNKIAAEQDYVKELSETELHLASVKLAEDARAAGEETKTLQLQASLLGQTVEQRNVILAQRKAEVDLAKQLAEIDKINTNGDPAKEAEKQAARQQAIDTARVKSVNAADKTILDEWQKNSDSIEKSLENALVTGFNSGKGMATSLKDWIKKEFESLAIKFLLEPMIAPFSSQLAGQMMQLQGQNLSFGGGTLGGGSGLNLNSFSNIGGSFSNMGSGISNSISGLFGASSIATSTGSSILEGGSAGIVDSSAAGYAGLDAAGASSLGGGASVMGGAAMSGVSSAIPYVGALYAASQGKYGAAAGMAIGTMIMPGIGTIVGAIIGSLLDGKGGGPKQDGTSAGYVGPLGSGDRSTANDVAATAISSNLQSQFDSLVSAGGGTSNLQFGAGYSMDPKGTSPTFLDIMATQGKGGATAYDNLNLSVGRSDAEFQKAITDMSNKALLDGLQKANIEGSLANYLNGLGLIANMTAADAQTAVTKVETALTQKASIDDKIFDLTHTQEEILTKNRTAELKTIDDTNQALQKRLYALQDEATAAQTLISAVQAAGQMIASVNNSIRAYLDKLNATPAGMLTPAEQLGNAKLQFEQQLTLARAGDQTALQGITGYGDQLITAQKGYSASGTDTSKTIDYVKQQLVGLPQMQTTEQQLALIAQNTSNTTSVMKDAGDKIWDGLWGSSGALATEFNQLDLDTSGNLNFNELKNAVGPLATDATLRALIARVDANGDGQISKLEAIGASIPETTANAAITAANVVTTPVPTPPPPAPQPFGPDAKEVAYGAQVPSGYHYAGTSGGKYYVVPGAPPETYNGFAGGGVMSSLGALPLHTYARGGVATSAQMAIFGEGSMNEAYVPLPDGRSIPVSMGGQGALIAEIKALRAEVARLRQIAQTGNQIAAMGAKGTINAVGEVANNTSGALAAAKLARAAAPVGKAAKV